jgi:hypothetical protein
VTTLTRCGASPDTLLILCMLLRLHRALIFICSCTPCTNLHLHVAGAALYTNLHLQLDCRASADMLAIIAAIMHDAGAALR